MVFDIWEYLQAGWHHTAIAGLFRLSSEQVLAAVEYIERHKSEVMAEYEKIMQRIDRGNPPKLAERFARSHARLLARWPHNRPRRRTLPSILADNNEEGHLTVLLRIPQCTIWREVWEQAGVTVHTFESVGLARDATDSLLSQVCQQREVILVNRH